MWKPVMIPTVVGHCRARALETPRPPNSTKYCATVWKPYRSELLPEDHTDRHSQRGESYYLRRFVPQLNLLSLVQPLGGYGSCRYVCSV